MPLPPIKIPTDWGVPDAPAAADPQPSGLRRLIAGVLRVAGPVGGSILGGTAGTLLDPIIGPAGTIGGGMAGGAAGGGLGEYLAEKAEGRKEINPYHVGVSTVVGGIPVGRFIPGVVGHAAEGAALAEGGNMATRKSEGGNILPSKEELPGDVLTTAGGGLLGGLLSYYFGKGGGAGSAKVPKGAALPPDMQVPAPTNTGSVHQPTKLPSTEDIYKTVRTTTAPLGPIEQGILNEELNKGNTKLVSQAFKVRKDLAKAKDDVSGVVNPNTAAQIARNEKARANFLQGVDEDTVAQLEGDLKSKAKLNQTIKKDVETSQKLEAKDQAQDARNANATDKFTRKVEVARDQADTEAGKRVAADQKVQQAAWAQEGRNQNAADKYRRSVEIARDQADTQQAKLDRNAANQAIIDAAKEGKEPVIGNPKESYTADNGTGKESVTVTHREPPPPPEGEEGGGGGGGPVLGPDLPQLGQVFSSREQANDAARALRGAVRVTTKGSQVVPAEYGVRGAVPPPPGGPAIDEAAGLGLPEPNGPTGQGPTNTPPPWKPIPPRTSQAKPNGNGVKTNGAPAVGSNDEEAIFNALATDAMKQGFRGDPDVLRSAFNEKMAQAKDLHQTMNDAEVSNDPTNLFRKIASYGGIGGDTQYPGEIRRLWENSKGGVIRGVKGVLNKTGKGRTLDDIAQSLKQDPEFAHIEGPNELLQAMEDARLAKTSPTTLESAAEGAGLRKGTKWWEAPAAPENPSDFSDIEANTAAQDAAHKLGLQRPPESEPPTFTRASQGPDDMGGAPAEPLVEGTSNTNSEIEAARDRAAERRIAEFERRVGGKGGRRAGDTRLERDETGVIGERQGDISQVADRIRSGVVPKEVEPAIPGLEDVVNTENPTPQVAEAPFGLTPETAAAPKPVEAGDLLAEAAAPEPQAPPQGGAIPARFYAGPVEAAGDHYTELKGENPQVPGAPRQDQPARIAGRAAQRIAKTEQAGVDSQAQTAAQLQADLDAIKKDPTLLQKFLRGESGAVSPLLAQRLGLGGAGALYGGATGDTPENRIERALEYGAFGALLPSVWGGSQELLDGFDQYAPKAKGGINAGLEHLNTVHNIGLFGPSSLAKKGLADAGGLATAAIEHPTQAGALIQALTKGAPEAWAAGKGAFNSDLPENAAGMTNMLHRGPLSWIGRGMAGFTGATKNVLDQAGFSPELQSYYTGTAQPQTKILKDALRLIQKNPVLRNIAPTARMMINRGEGGYEHSVFGLLKAANSELPAQERHEALVKALLGTAATVGAYEATPDDFVKRHPALSSIIAASAGAPLSIPVGIGMGLKTISKSPWSDAVKNISREVPGLEMIEDAGRDLPATARNYLASYTNSLKNSADLYSYIMGTQDRVPDINSPESHIYSKALSNIPAIREMLPAKQTSLSGLKMPSEFKSLKMPKF